MEALKNKWAVILPNVVLTPTIDRCLVQVDKACEAKQFKMFITSGLRDENHQLRIIRTYATNTGIAKDFAAGMTCKFTDKSPDGKIYLWQPLWSRLCHMGYIIAPPMDAIALEDYNYFGRNLKGLVCPKSNHIAGHAWDADGGANGIKDETELVEWGIKEGIITYVLNLVPERNNNCLHSNCKPV